MLLEATLPPVDPESLKQIMDKASLFRFLRDELKWEVDPEDTFTYDEPGLGEGHVQVSRFVPFDSDDAFVIMLVEFAKPFRSGDLREVLRRIRKKIREMAAYGGATFDKILFVCAIDKYHGIRFARFDGLDARRVTLSIFGWDRDTRALQTLCKFNLPPLRYDVFAEGGKGFAHWGAAFNVRRVSDHFFLDFRKRFRALEAALRVQSGDSKWAHDWALQFLSRLMFLYFIQRKRTQEGEFWLGNNRNFVSNFGRVISRPDKPRTRSIPTGCPFCFLKPSTTRSKQGARNTWLGSHNLSGMRLPSPPI